MNPYYEDSSSTDSEYETDVEEDEEDEEDFEDMEAAETYFESAEKQDGAYYLGLSWRNTEHLLMNGTVSARTFLAYDYARVWRYVQAYSVFYVCPTQHIQIMQLHICRDGTYAVSLKTYWLRLVQRRWKRVYRERERIIALRMSVRNQEYFRITGRYLEGTRVFPSLRGMLADYLRVSK